MGDLNYRIDMKDDILRAWVAEKRYTNVLEKDQVSFFDYLGSMADKVSYVMTSHRVNLSPISRRARSNLTRSSPVYISHKQLI